MSNEKVLITGHKGTIGKVIFKLLNNLGYKVYGYDVGDKLVNRKYDFIIHCAAKCIIRDVIKHPQQMMGNIEITYKVMELARKHNSKVILLSSGRVGHNEKNPYIVSKRFLEDIAEAYHTCYNIESIIIRPETVWSFNEPPIRVIPNWIYCAMNNKDIVIYGNRKKELSPISVNDFVDVLLQFITNFTHHYKPILVTGEIQKAVSIAEEIIRQHNSTSKIIFKPAEKTQPQVCKDIEYTIRV